MTFGQLHDGPEAMQCDNMQIQNNFQMEGMGGQTFKMFKMLHPVKSQNQDQDNQTIESIVSKDGQLLSITQRDYDTVL